VWLCILWVVQNTQQHPFPVHAAGGVHTFRNLFPISHCPSPAALFPTCTKNNTLLLYRTLQVSMPLVTVEGLPVGLSLIGPFGKDEALLASAAYLIRAL